MDLQNLLKNRNIQTNLFIVVIGISLVSLFETKTLIALIVILLLIVNYAPLVTAGDTTEQIKQDIKKNEISDDIYYNSSIHDILIELKQFKKYNKVSYKEGVRYLRRFIKTIYILEHDDMMNSNQYFENALIYLKTGINHFQSITVSLPERTFLSGIKYGDFEPTKKVTKLGNLCKKLYNECYYILQNLSVKFNDQWSKGPNIYTKEIDMNSERVEQYNKTSEINWSLY